MEDQKKSLVVLGSEGYVGTKIKGYFKDYFDILEFDIRGNPSYDINLQHSRIDFIHSIKDKNIYAVINCIAVGYPADFYDFISKQALDSFETNALSPLLFLREIEPFMDTKKVILFSSIITDYPTKQDLTYLLSKKAVEASADYLKQYFDVLCVKPKVLNGGIGKLWFNVLEDKYKGDINDYLKEIESFL